MSEIVHDATISFTRLYVDRRSRTVDQMVQAARSEKQNIAEGSMASGTSKKMDLKLVGVARASLEELLLDYTDFLRQNEFEQGQKTMRKPSLSESSPTSPIGPIRLIRPISKRKVPPTPPTPWSASYTKRTLSSIVYSASLSRPSQKRVGSPNGSTAFARIAESKPERLLLPYVRTTIFPPAPLLSIRR